MAYRVTKTYGHERGLSCCFRQWRADSHCNQLHGYALSFEFVFEAKELDERNWVLDFGGLKYLETLLKQAFDHTTIVANDDPLISLFRHMQKAKMIDLWIVDKVGCEMFAEHAFDLAERCIRGMKITPRVRVVSCKVSEHGANSATYIKENA